MIYLETVKVYSICFLIGLLAVLYLVSLVPLKTRYQKIICLVTTIKSYAWALFLLFFCPKSENMWGIIRSSSKTFEVYFEYDLTNQYLLLTTFSVLVLVIISVELSTMPPKNEELGELELDERVNRRVIERLSKIVTLLFLGAQFCLSHAMFWFYFM
jgi:hypothetical protein